MTNTPHFVILYIYNHDMMTYGLYYLDGYQVTLDKKAVKTPHGRHLCVPYQPLAAALSVEWDAQEDVIKPEFMHLVGSWLLSCNIIIIFYTLRQRLIVIMTFTISIIN